MQQATVGTDVCASEIYVVISLISTPLGNRKQGNTALTIVFTCVEKSKTSKKHKNVVLNSPNSSQHQEKVFLLLH